MIEPLGDAARDAPVLNQPLAEFVKTELAAAGVEAEQVRDFGALPADGPYIVLPDNLFLNRHVVAAFLQRATDDQQLGTAPSRFITESLPLQDGVDPPPGEAAAAFRMARVSKRPANWEEIASLPASIVDLVVEEKKLENVPRAFSPDGVITFPWTSRPIMRLTHWIHVLRANQYGLMAVAAGYRERSKARNLISLIGLLIKAFPPTEARIGRALVTKGKGCKIHPSAVVEASILGDNVRIDPHAVVRGSILGDGAVVESHGHVQLSVLGAGAVTTKYTMANFCLLYPGAVLGAFGAQMSLIGRDAFAATYSVLMDLSFEGDVKVQKGGRVVSCGARFLGVCIGHEARVGAGVYVAHGRAIPNGTSVVKNPRDVLQKIGDPDDRGPLAVLDGTAISLAALLRNSS